VSPPQSRQRQRHKRRARTKLWDAQRQLAERQVDLVSYDRVIADMERRDLSPFSGSIAVTIVHVCRDATRLDCKALSKKVADLEQRAEDLEPRAS